MAAVIAWPRSGAPPSRHRRRCGADARSRAAAPCRAARQSPRQLRFSRSRIAHGGVGHISVVQEIEQFAATASVVCGEGDQRSTVSASSAAPRGHDAFGPGDETRVDGARPHDSAPAPQKRPRPRLRSVTSSMIKSAERPSQLCGAAKPDECRISAPSEDRAGIVARCTTRRRRRPAVRRRPAPHRLSPPAPRIGIRRAAEVKRWPTAWRRCRRARASSTPEP